MIIKQFCGNVSLFFTVILHFMITGYNCKWIMTCRYCCFSSHKNLQLLIPFTKRNSYKFLSKAIVIFFIQKYSEKRNLTVFFYFVTLKSEIIAVICGYNHVIILLILLLDMVKTIFHDTIITCQYRCVWTYN